VNHNVWPIYYLAILQVTHLFVLFDDWFLHKFLS